MIGVGATVLYRLSVADGITIGGGGLAHRSIAAAGAYVGVRVRPVPASLTLSLRGENLVGIGVLAGI